MAVQLGGWLGGMSTGIESSAVLGAEVPVSHTVGLTAFGGVQRHADGSLDPRDASLGVSWLPIAKPTAVLRIATGLNIPTGGIGSGLFITPLSTASFDPVVMVDATLGGTWVAATTIVARVPLYEGWDQIRQGAFVRLDARGARRIGDVVPWLGLSGVRQLASDPRGAAPDFSELAGTGGAVANLSPRWSLTGQVRASLLVSDGTERQLSGGLNARLVIGNQSAHDSKHDD